MQSADVVGQMVAAGLESPPLPLKFNTRWPVRFGPKKAHWYALREERTDGGTYVVLGSFGCWRSGQKHRVDVDWKGLGDAERAELEQRRQAHAEADARARSEAAAQAALSAGDLWARARRTGSSAYLKRKGVQGEACRYLADGAIVVPLLRYDEPRETALKALQVIRADGTKRFTKGFQKPGVCLRLGHAEIGEPVLVCEGYATALTLRQALDRRLPVVVALDAGNLLPVCELWRALLPQCPLLICADDDFMTVGNPGRHRAHLASKAVPDTAYTFPIFRPHNRGPKDTDFNDLAAAEGLGTVRRQLRHVLPWLSAAMQDAA